MFLQKEIPHFFEILHLNKIFDDVFHEESKNVWFVENKT